MQPTSVLTFISQSPVQAHDLTFKANWRKNTSISSKTKPSVIYSSQEYGSGLRHLTVGDLVRRTLFGTISWSYFWLARRNARKVSRPQNANAAVVGSGTTFPFT